MAFKTFYNGLRDASITGFITVTAWTNIQNFASVLFVWSRLQGMDGAAIINSKAICLHTVQRTKIILPAVSLTDRTAICQQTAALYHWKEDKKLSCRKETTRLHWLLVCCVSRFWLNVTGRRYFADITHLSSANMTRSTCKATEFGEVTQNNGYCSVQGHSGHTPVLVPIESPYATSY